LSSKRVYRALTKSLALCALITLCLTAQESPKQDASKGPQWTDRAEFDLYQTGIVTPLRAGQYQIALSNLDKWKSQYPDSQFKEIRLELYLATYGQLKRPRDVATTAQEILKIHPNNENALRYLVENIYQLANGNQAPEADLAAAEQASRTIIDNGDTVFNKENRLPDLTDDTTPKAEKELQVFAQRTLGWIDLQRKNYPKAITDLTAALKSDPTQAVADNWMGQAIVAQKDTSAYPLAIFEFTRAADYDGPNSLPAASRKSLHDYAARIYDQYHGSHEGFDQLESLAKLNALPPPGWKLESATDIAQAKIDAENAAAKANPMLALWKDIKGALLAPDGDAYFTQMKGSLVPAGAEVQGTKVEMFKGKLVSQEPAMRPKTLVLAVEDPEGKTPDVTLKLDEALPGKMEPGSVLSFEGQADSYTKSPYMLTFLITDRKWIEGWEAKNPPLIHRKATTTTKKQ